MSDLEQQLSSILGNPQMMAQIQQIASSMQAGSQPSPGEDDHKEEPAMQASASAYLPPDMLKMAMTLSQKSHMDKKQQALLSALRPYLSKEKAQKLQSAMEAAHLAQLATHLIGGNFSGGGDNV